METSKSQDPRIKDLENKTKMSLEALTDLKSKSFGDPIWYLAFLTILTDPNFVVGTEINMVSDAGIPQKLTIDKTVISYIRTQAQNSKYASEYKKTPVAQNNSILEENGKEGVICAANPENISSSPITGPQKNSSILAENLLNQIHPNFTDTVEKYCNIIRTRSYLSLSPGCFSSFQSAVNNLNGVVASIQQAIFNIYKGVTQAIQQFYSYINGLILQIQKFGISLIDSIIPLDLICMVLEAVQVLMDDINFFSSLFGQQGSIFQYLNNFQNYLNQASTLVSNPFSTLNAYIPPEIKNLIDMVDQMGSDPNGFLADNLSNYGYSWALNVLQGDIVGGVINKYGPQYAAIGPIGQLLNSSESYSRNMGTYNSTPASIGPNVYSGHSGKNLDTNLNPIKLFEASVSDFIKSVGSAADTVKTQVGNIFQ